MEGSNDPTVTHPWMRALRRLRGWAARKTAPYGRDAKRQFIRGASYGLGSGAVSLLILWVQARY